MIEQGKGVIMMLSSSAARESGLEMVGLSLALRVARVLHQEPRRRGRQTRRPGGVAAAELHAGDLTGACGSGIGAMTGAVVNLTCGAILD